MIKIKLVVLFVFFCIFNLWSQKSSNNLKKSDFKSDFKTLNTPLLIDDITIKYSKNKEIKYSVIKDYIKDSSGQLLIIIDNERHHQFKEITSKKINDSISYYVFSHKSNIKGASSNYYAYIAIFNKDKLVDFRTIYSNSIEGTNKNYGSVIIANKFIIFQSKEFDYEYFRIDNNGFIHEDDLKISISDISLKRENKYKIEFNSKFYKEEKVLLPVKKINGYNSNKMLSEIANEKLKLKQTFFIDIYNKNEHTEVVYLNLLRVENDIYFRNAYEVIKDLYDIEGNWLKNISLSDFFIMPNGMEIIDSNVLDMR
jgi:hypothetical protein